LPDCECQCVLESTGLDTDGRLPGTISSSPKPAYLTPGIDKDKLTQQGATCSLADEKRTESSASWKMVCKLADGTLIDMTINNSVSKHSLRSDVKQVIDKGNGKPVQMQIAMSSKFIGECTKDMPQL
jgi:hypothetical protein